MTNKTTFQDFIGSATKSDDLRDYAYLQLEHDKAIPGWLYLGSYYIEVIQRNAGDNRPTFNVVLGSDEYLFETLPEAEKFFWESFVLTESNHDLTFVKFYFSDDPTFEGYADGTTWNGFDNIRVTEKVHKAVIAHFTAEAGLGVDLEDAMESFNEIEPDQFGLYDYGNGFATSIDEDHYHTVNR